jgi:hypothetical protein
MRLFFVVEEGWVHINLCLIVRNIFGFFLLRKYVARLYHLSIFARFWLYSVSFYFLIHFILLYIVDFICSLYIISFLFLHRLWNLWRATKERNGLCRQRWYFWLSHSYNNRHKFIFNIFILNYLLLCSSFIYLFIYFFHLVCLLIFFLLVLLM